MAVAIRAQTVEPDEAVTRCFVGADDFVTLEHLRSSKTGIVARGLQLLTLRIACMFYD